jgi:nucleotide-binding universal stress UspA family protein
MNNIIVATDFSNGAENAARYARLLARTKGCKLTYLHILTLPVVDPMVNSALVSRTVEDLKINAEEQLQALTAKDREEGLNSTFVISFEDIITALDELPEEDLLVIGKTGHRTFLDRLIGSTAQNLVNEVKQPLLVIPEAYSGDPLQKMCYASRMEFNEKHHIGAALEWSALSPEDLVIAHILEDFPLDINSNEQFQASIDKDFERKGYSYKNFSAEAYKEGISEFIEKEGISLLFVTARKRGFLEGIVDPSQTKGMINAAKVPVMVFNYKA